MRDKMGKYIRHGLAALLGTLIAAGFRYTGGEMDPGLVRDFSDAVAGVLTPGILVLVYAWTEKFLKHFKWLDPQGYADRKLIQREADKMHGAP